MQYKTPSPTSLERMAGRLYFLLVLPFFGAAVGPWMLGALDQRELPVLLLWSGVVFVFLLGLKMGALLIAKDKYISLYALASLVLFALGLIALILGLTKQSFLVAVVLLGLCYWLDLLQLKRSVIWSMLSDNIRRQHQRFVWTVLACQMFVLMNIVAALRAGSAA